MKRMLRVVLLGPIFAIFWLAVTAVAPLLALIYWLCDESLSEYLALYRDLFRESFGGVWKGGL